MKKSLASTTDKAPKPKLSIRKERSPTHASEPKAAASAPAFDDGPSPSRGGKKSSTSTTGKTARPSPRKQSAPARQANAVPTKAKKSNGHLPTESSPKESTRKKAAAPSPAVGVKPSPSHGMKKSLASTTDKAPKPKLSIRKERSPTHASEPKAAASAPAFDDGPSPSRGGKKSSTSTTGKTARPSPRKQSAPARQANAVPTKSGSKRASSNKGNDRRSSSPSPTRVSNERASPALPPMELASDDKDSGDEVVVFESEEESDDDGESFRFGRYKISPPPPDAPRPRRLFDARATWAKAIKKAIAFSRFSALFHSKMDARFRIYPKTKPIVAESAGAGRRSAVPGMSQPRTRKRSATITTRTCKHQGKFSKPVGQGRTKPFAVILGIDRTPHYLPTSSEGYVWVPYPTMKAFEAIGEQHTYRRPTILNGIVWGLHSSKTSIPKGEECFPARTTSWNDKLNPGFPTTAPVADPDSVWVPFADEEGYSALQYEDVHVDKDTHWVNFESIEMAPNGESYYKSRNRCHADTAGYQELPCFLPVRELRNVWVPYPERKYVPHDLDIVWECSQRYDDGNFWACFPRATCAQRGERYFAARTTSFTDMLGISYLPLALSAVNAESAVWACFPDKATFDQSFRRTYYPQFNTERRDGFWTVLGGVEDVYDGEKYFEPRRQSFNELLGIESLPKWMPKGPKGACWAVYPSREVFFDTPMPYALKTIEHEGAFWVLHGSQEAIPKSEMKFLPRTQDVTQELSLARVPRELPSGEAGSVWIPFIDETYIPPSVSPDRVYHLKSPIELHWVLFDSKEHAFDVCPFHLTMDSTSNIESREANVDRTRTPTKEQLARWPGTLPRSRNEGALWFVYHTKDDMNTSPGTKITFATGDGFYRDGFFIGLVTGDFEGGKEVARFPVCDQSLSEFFKLPRKAPQNLPMGPPGAVWEAYPSREVFDQLGPSMPYFKVEHKDAYWAMFGNLTQIHGDWGMRTRTETFAEILNVTNQPDNLPHGQPGGVWLPLPSDDSMPVTLQDKVAIIELGELFWAYFPNKTMLEEVFPGETYFEATSTLVLAQEVQDLLNKCKGAGMKENIKFYGRFAALQEKWSEDEAVKFAVEVEKKLPAEYPLADIILVLRDACLLSCAEDAINVIVVHDPADWQANLVKIVVRNARKFMNMVKPVQMLKEYRILNDVVTDDELDTYKRNVEAIHKKLSTLEDYTPQMLRNWAADQKKRVQNGGLPDDVTTRLAMLAHGVLLCNSFYPRNIQLLAVLVLLNSSMSPSSDCKGMLAEVHTGEGKSVIVMMLAAFKVMEAKSVDVITSSETLAVPQSYESAEFFDYFGQTVTHNISGKGRPTFKQHYAADVVYGTSHEFECAIIYDYFFGRKPLVRSARPYNVAIVDEVDSMLLDEVGGGTRISSPIEGLDRFVGFYRVMVECTREAKDDAAAAEAAFRKRIVELKWKKIVPNYLHNFFELQISIWSRTCQQALYHMDRDKDYVVMRETGDDNKMKIVPVDYASTGTVQMTTVWSYGTQQFLQIKEGLELDEESLDSCIVTNLLLFGLYQQLYGTTGTLGDTYELAEVQKVHRVDFRRFPTFVPVQLERLPPTITSTRRSWLTKIRDKARQQAYDGRAVLIIFETIAQTRLANAELPEASVMNGKEDFEFRNRIIETAGKSGHITLATNLAGRGMDVKTSKDVDAHGGLHVIRTYLECNQRVSDQASGRTARCGKPGTVELVLLDNDWPQKDVKFKRRERAEAYSRRLTELIKRRDELAVAHAERRLEFQVPLAQLRDAAFLEICKTLGGIDPSNKNKGVFQAGYEVMKSVIEEKPSLTKFMKKGYVLWKKCAPRDNFEREGAQQMWAFWLQRINGREYYLKTDEERLQYLADFTMEFGDFIKDLNHRIESQDTLTSPFLRIKRGNHKQLEDEYDAALDDYKAAAEMDPNLSMAHHNQAICMLQIRTTKVKDAYGHFETARKMLKENEKALREFAEKVGDGKLTAMVEETQACLKMLEQLSSGVQDTIGQLMDSPIAELGKEVLGPLTDVINEAMALLPPGLKELYIVLKVGFTLWQIMERHNRLTADPRIHRRGGKLHVVKDEMYTLGQE